MLSGGLGDLSRYVGDGMLPGSEKDRNHHDLARPGVHARVQPLGNRRLGELQMRHLDRGRGHVANQLGETLHNTVGFRGTASVVDEENNTFGAHPPKRRRHRC